MLKVHQQQAWENRIEADEPMLEQIRLEPSQA
jgi:hypothetical protein